MFLDERKTAVCCGLDCGLLTAAEADSVLRIVSQIPDPKSDISGNGHLQTVSKILKEKGVALLRLCSGK